MSSTVALLQSGNQGPFAVPEEDQEEFGELVRNALLKELGRSKKFELVDEIGPIDTPITGSDRVKVQLSPYDLKRGRIVYRMRS